MGRLTSRSKCDRECCAAPISELPVLAPIGHLYRQVDAFQPARPLPAGTLAGSLERALASEPARSEAPDPALPSATERKETMTKRHVKYQSYARPRNGPRNVNRCSACGGANHNRRTCPNFRSRTCAE